jgi:hypothetical protein
VGKLTPVEPGSRSGAAKNVPQNRTTEKKNGTRTANPFSPKHSHEAVVGNGKRAYAEEGEGEVGVPTVRSTRARAAAAASATRKEPEKKPAAKKRKDRKITQHAPMPTDDTLSIHSGGGLLTTSSADFHEGNFSASRADLKGSHRQRALRVDLEGGYCAFIVCDAGLPTELRQRVTGTGNGLNETPVPSSTSSEMPSTTSNGMDVSGISSSITNGSHATRVQNTSGQIRDPENKDDTQNRTDADASPADLPLATSHQPSLWVIVQSAEVDETGAAHRRGSAQTPVPGAHVQPSRGILRHRHSKPVLRPRSDLLSLVRDCVMGRLIGGGGGVGVHGGGVGVDTEAVDGLGREIARASVDGWPADARALPSATATRVSQAGHSEPTPFFGADFHASHQNSDGDVSFDDSERSPDAHSGASRYVLGLSQIQAPTFADCPRVITRITHITKH